MKNYLESIFKAKEIFLNIFEGSYFFGGIRNLTQSKEIS